MKRPNIILMMSDQQRYDAVGYCKQTAVKTPCLDQLAAEGIQFNAAYTPFPLCVPARSCLFRGTYINSEWDAEHHRMTEGEWTFVRELRDSGYRTAAIGKMHFHPMYADHGFDVMHLAEHDPTQEGCFAEDNYHRELAEMGLRDEQEEWQYPSRYIHSPREYQENLQAVPFPLPEEQHSTAWIGREAIRFLQDQREEQPFFLFVSLLRPHHPFNPPEPYDKLYPFEDMDVPDPSSGWESLPEFMHPYFSNRLAHGTFDLTQLDRALLQKITSYYYGTITHIDDWMAKILEHVDRENTIVIYTSDHGEYLGARGRLMKDPQVPLDDLMRIPFVASWPGQWTAQTVDTPISLVDLAPTLLEISGIKEKAGLDGKSLLPLLEGNVGSEWQDRAIFAETQLTIPSLMVRQRHWKYIWHPEEKVAQLYDLAADPMEQHNMSGYEDHAEIEAQLHSLVVDWKQGEAQAWK